MSAALAPWQIAAVDIALCALPLDRPVEVGRTVYREREYVMLRVRLADGTCGDAFGYTRGLPLLAMLQRLAPSIVGEDATRRAEILEGLVASNVNATAGLARPLGIVDVALSDALARIAGLPLWRLLGGARSRVPLLAVGGYAAGERGIPDVVEELCRLADAGFRSLKLHTGDPELARRATAALRDSASLAVDVGMVWRTVPEAIERCRVLDDLGLSFIEDPFVPDLWQWTAELAGHIRTPLAAGEDAPGAARLIDLIDGVGVLRIDATASGGFDAVLQAAAVAAARGRRVMTHAFPDLHAHLAGSPAVECVEMIPDDSGANPIGQLLARRQAIEGGELVLSEEPGHGAPLDWDAVVRHARRLVTIDAREEGKE